MGGVALLPQELGGAQEQPRAQLPAHDVGPLVEQQRQVPVALDPAGHRVADDRLGGRAHGQRLGQLLTAAVGDHRQLGAEALDVLGLTLEQGHRDEHREVDVVVPGGLDALVQLGLHPLPDAEAPRLDDHRAAHQAVLGHAGLGDDLLVPAREVLGLRGEHGRSHARQCSTARAAGRRRDGS